MPLHKATQAEADRSMMCYHAFMFTLNIVSVAIEHELTNDEYLKIWDAVKAVAESEQTVRVSPAEILDPSMLPAMRDHIQVTSTNNIWRDRELAERLRRAAEGFAITDATSG